MANIWGNSGNSDRLLFGAPKSLQIVTAAMKLKDACSLEEKLWPTRQHVKKQRHYFADKGPSSQSYGFFSSHVWMWELDFGGISFSLVAQSCPTFCDPMDCSMPGFPVHHQLLKLTQTYSNSCPLSQWCHQVTLRVFSNTTVPKHQFSSAQLSL